jgi:hypothetical protein
MWSERRKRTQTRGGFINETIPYPIVAWMANKLYKEHYTVVPTKHEITKEEQSKVKFEWLLNNKWTVFM